MSTSQKTPIQPAAAATASVWKLPSSTQPRVQNHVNGVDDAHEKDSVSSKDIAHGEGSSQGHSTPASSMTDEAQIASPTPPAPVFRPAPLPAVNPWKLRQEEMERKRWKDSQDTPPVPLPVERVVPKPTVSKQLPKANGVAKPEVKSTVRRSIKGNTVSPPALEDSEAWPSPDVAAPAEKESRPKTTPVNPPRDGETREVKEPRETKKKKWEKLEVTFQYALPHKNRGRGGKFGRGGRGGARDPVVRGKEGERIDRDNKNRPLPRSDGEESSKEAPNAVNIGRRAQSLNLEPHGHAEMHPEWSMRPQFTAQHLNTVGPESWRTGPSPPRIDTQGRNDSARDLSARRSRSPGSSRGKNSSSPAGPKREIHDSHSPLMSPNGQHQLPDMPHWDDQENPSGSNSQFNQQANQARRGNGRGYRGGRNGFAPTFPQNQFPPPLQPQAPFPGYYGGYPPMPPGYVPNGRAQSVPYYSPNSPPRYSQQPYSPMMHDFSRLGVQPMSSIDEDLRQRIIHQVEYWFSSENLFKDVFLRQNMDSQGFVSLQLLVTFKRLRDISDDVGTVLHSLLVSNEVEVLFNSERGPLVRPRAEPTKWVYPIEERVESARHPGPAPSFFQSHQDTMRQMQEGYQQYQYPQQYYFDPQYGFPGGPFQRPNDPESMSPHLDLSANSPVSPQFDPQNRKLSGHAPVFVPGYGPPMTNGESGAYRFRAMRNAIPTANEVEEPVEVLDEENLATLVVIVHDNINRPIPPALPVNGVNHSGQGTAESLRTPLQPVTWRISDATAATQGSTTTASAVSGPSSVTSPSSPSRTAPETALTERNLQRQISQSGSQEFLYPEFRQKALRSRESSLRQQKESTQMNNLYQFWADFLRDYWVPSMYTEFLKFAVDDANNGRRSGLSHLFAMYERVLESKFRTSLWNDFVRLAGEDYRNGRYGGIERVWRIRKTHRGGNVRIRDGDVSRLVDHEINQHDDIERLSRGVKPASVVLVPYTTGQSA